MTMFTAISPCDEIDSGEIDIFLSLIKIDPVKSTKLPETKGVTTTTQLKFNLII